MAAFDQKHMEEAIALAEQCRPIADRIPKARTLMFLRCALLRPARRSMRGSARKYSATLFNLPRQRGLPECGHAYSREMPPLRVSIADPRGRAR
jgi:hypothetical protein